jgi:hypothetical protein
MMGDICGVVLGEQNNANKKSDPDLPPLNRRRKSIADLFSEPFFHTNAMLSREGGGFELPDSRYGMRTYAEL